MRNIYVLNLKLKKKMISMNMLVTKICLLDTTRQFDIFVADYSNSI